MKKVIVLAAVLGLALSNLTAAQPTKSKIFKKLMAEKLASSQALLEGLATNNFPKLIENGEELLRISSTAEWVAIKTPKYELFSNDFRRAAENIIKKAKAKNLDGAALAYVELTMTCVRCHQYVREVQEAKWNGPDGPATASAASGSGPGVD
jgi:hypothetical protein